MRSANAIAQVLLDQCENVSALLKGLSHPVRLKVMSQLLDGEKSVNQLTQFCEISQSAMSQFLSRMKADGLVAARRDGQFVFYYIQDQRLFKLMKALKEIYC